MDIKEKDFIINEIRKSNIMYDNNEEVMFFLTKGYSNLLDKLKNEKEIKKMLIHNDYGLLLNLLYKYKDNLEEDILMEMALKDIYIMKGLNEKTLMKHLELLPENVYYNFLNEERWILRLLFKMYNHDIKKYFRCIRKGLREDKNFLIKAISLNGEIFHYISNNLKKDEDFLLMLIQNDKIASVYFFNEFAQSLKSNLPFLVKVIENFNNCGFTVIYSIIKDLDEEIVLQLRDYFRDNKEIFEFIDIALMEKLSMIMTGEDDLPF